MKNGITKITAAAALVFASTGTLAGIGDGAVYTGGVLNPYSQLGFDTDGLLLSASIPLTVDNTITGWINQDAGTWGVSSNSLRYGLNWTAGNGQLITTAGSYSLDTATGALSAVGACTVANDGFMCFDVGAGQIAGTINVDWGATSMRIVNVWNINLNGSLTAVVVPGMENGPFPGFNDAFNFSAPNLVTVVPEASTYVMMLSGLGLIGFAARRRKQAETQVR